MARPRGGRTIGGWMMTPRMMESAGLVPQGSVNADGSLKEGIEPKTLFNSLTPEQKTEMKGDLREARKKNDFAVLSNNSKQKKRLQKAALTKEQKIEAEFKQKQIDSSRPSEQRFAKYEAQAWQQMRLKDKPSLLKSALKNVQSARKTGDKDKIDEANAIFSEAKQANSVKSFYSAQQKVDGFSVKKSLMSKTSRQSKATKTTKSPSTKGLTSSQKEALASMRNDRKAMLNALRSFGIPSGNLKTNKDLEVRLIALMKRNNKNNYAP